jgi:hypothetical protein
MRPAALRLLRLTAVTLPLALWLLVPAVASASCAMPIPIEEAIRSAEVVITGTVTAVENDGRWATVEVHEIWKGPDLPATVIIRGGPGPGSASSIDRTFTAGARYLFVAGLDGQGGLSDNACSATIEMAAGDNALRPADFRTPAPVDPAPAGVDLGGLVAPIAVALLVAAALLGMGLLARGRQAS